MSTGEVPVLYGVFRALLDRGIPLGLPDYLDALRALRRGFGGFVEDAGQPRHARLRWLCEALWARDETETRLIRDVLAALERPTPEEVVAVEDWLGVSLRQPIAPTFEPRETSSTETDSGSVFATHETKVAKIEEPRTLHLRFETADRLQEGWRLPPQATRLPASEPFILTPETYLDMRTLAVAWRRLRSLVRIGPKLELDLDATIERRCREGALARPVMRARRVNRGRLLVLVDASESMAPWMPLIEVIEQSLLLGRLQRAELLYFRNVPSRMISPQRTLSPTLPVRHLIAGANGSAVLIVSDAGASRRLRDYRRADETNLILLRIASGAQSVVWFNPTPPHRWRETTAEQIAQFVPMLPLTRHALTRAIDVLRGLKAG